MSPWTMIVIGGVGGIAFAVAAVLSIRRRNLDLHWSEPALLTAAIVWTDAWCIAAVCA